MIIADTPSLLASPTKKVWVQRWFSELENAMLKNSVSYLKNRFS